MYIRLITSTLLILSSFYSYSQLWYITQGLNTDEVAWGVDTDDAGNIYWSVEQKNDFPYWYYNIVLKDDYLYITGETGSFGNGQLTITI